MKPFTQIALSTGHVFEVPTDIIARNRAKTMQELHPGEFSDLDASLVDTHELFEDSSEIRDWALNNMNPGEYLPSARLVRFVPPEQDFATAEWTYHDHGALVGELDGETIMRQPVEAVMSTLAASGQICNVTVLNDDGGQPFGMMALIIGQAPVIGAFVQALQLTSEQVYAAVGAIPKSVN